MTGAKTTPTRRPQPEGLSHSYDRRRNRTSEEEMADIKKSIQQTKEFNLQRFREIDDAQAEQLLRGR